MNNVTRKVRERLQREEEIVTAAEKVFCEKGYENSSMDIIAKEAQFTKRTLYQYFCNKEDLYFAVVLRGYKMLAQYMQQLSEKENTGYNKIYQCGKGYYTFYNEHPENLKLMSFVGHVRKSTPENSPNLNKMLQFNNELFQSFAKIVLQGQADGSIISNVDAFKVTFSIIFMLTGFFNQLSFTGDSFMKHFSLDRGEFCIFSLDMLFQSIKSR